MRYALTVAALLFAVVIAVPRAQQNPRTLGAGSGVAMVVDFAAVDAKGQAVTDLVTADVSIRIDGKPRQIRSLQFVRREKASLAGGPASTPLPLPFGSNVSGGSAHRTVFVIFDNETLPAGREQRVRDGVIALINLLGPGDQAAVLTVPHGGVATPLTSDHSVLLAAAGKLAGSAPSAESAEEAACRSRLTLQAITGILAQRAGTDAPTEVVFVSSSLSGPRSSLSAGNTTLGRGSISGCELPSSDFTALGAAASAARARVYIIRPEASRDSTPTGLDNPLTGLESVASVTGGFLWHMAGADEPGFQRVATETSGYYAATIEVDPADRDATSPPLSIKTARADVTIRSRPIVTLRAAAAGRGVSPKDMLRTATVFTDTPLRLSAFASRNAGDGKVKIVVIAESATAAKFSAAAIGLYDTAGKLVAQWSADAPALAAPSLLTAFLQAPGQYRVRVAATDTAGRSGTADYDLAATLTPAAGVLTLSGMVLGTPDNNFTPKLQFTTEPQAVAYFELYGGKPGMPVSVNVDLATTLDGPPWAQLQPKIAASAEPDKYVITVPIALGALPPGDYIVRAIVGLDGQPAGRIVRTLRKTQ